MRTKLATALLAVIGLGAGASSAPARAQTGPPCGSDQLEVEASVGKRYATHVYEVRLEIDRQTPTRDYSASADHVQVTGPAGVVRRMGDLDTVIVAPQVAGTLSLAVSWEQAAYARGAPPCAAAATLELPVLAPIPVTLATYRHGTRAYFESWPCGGAATCDGARGNRFGIFFYLAAGKRDPDDGYDWDAADLTPMRVEARAAAGAKRPSPAVEPAVLEFAPLARQPRRAKKGLVEIVRRRGGEALELWVATRPGFFRRGVSFSFSQGTRSLGSFTATGRCYSTSSFGGHSTNCDFKGRHSWLWAPCREAVLIRGVFFGCRK